MANQGSSKKLLNKGSNKSFSLRDNIEYLKIGDIVLTTHVKSHLSRTICFVEKKYSKDRCAKYSHGNIIYGFSFKNNKIYFLDTLHKVKITDDDNYINQPCAVFRIRNIPTKLKNKIFYNFANEEIGKRYPYFRLILFLLKLADNLTFKNRLVCSERQMKFINRVLKEINNYDYSNNWHGWNPDMVYDECISKPEIFKLIYEGHV